MDGALGDGGCKSITGGRIAKHGIMAREDFEKKADENYHIWEWGAYQGSWHVMVGSPNLFVATLGSAPRTKGRAYKHCKNSHRF